MIFPDKDAVNYNRKVSFPLQVPFFTVFKQAMVCVFHACFKYISSALYLLRIKCLQHEIDIQLSKGISVLFAVPRSHENILYK